jgi:hypothetical protein
LLNVHGEDIGKEKQPADKASLPIILVTAFNKPPNLFQTFGKSIQPLAFLGFPDFLMKTSLKSKVVTTIGFREDTEVTGRARERT